MILIGTHQAIAQARDVKDLQYVLWQMVDAINRLSGATPTTLARAITLGGNAVTTVTVTGSIVRSGVETTVQTTGTVVTFSVPFLDAGYAVLPRGYLDADPLQNVNVTVVKTATNMTLYPDFNDTTIEWVAQETAVGVSGLEPGANMTGVTVNFPNPFATTAYVVMPRGYDATNPLLAVNVRVGKSVGSMILYPDQDNTDIEWTAQEATQ